MQDCLPEKLHAEAQRSSITQKKFQRSLKISQADWQGNGKGLPYMKMVHKD